MGSYRESMICLHDKHVSTPLLLVILLLIIDLTGGLGHAWWTLVLLKGSDERRGRSDPLGSHKACSCCQKFL